MGGDSEEGGGGSFHWKVSAKNSDHADHAHNGKQVDQSGSDDPGELEPGEKFTVSIKLPAEVSSADFLNAGIIDGGRVYFILPLEDDKTQVRVSWGEDNPNNRGRKPKPVTGSTTQAGS